MAKRQEWTPEQRAEVIELYQVHGVAETVRRTGVPRGTISDWVKQAGVQTSAAKTAIEATELSKARNNEKYEELKGLVLDTAKDMILRTKRPHKDYRGKEVIEVWWDEATADACKNYVTSAAIMIDKYRLMSGESTENIQVTTRNEKEQRVANIVGISTKRSA